MLFHHHQSSFLVNFELIYENKQIYNIFFNSVHNIYKYYVLEPLISSIIMMVVKNKLSD